METCEQASSTGISHSEVSVFKEINLDVEFGAVLCPVTEKRNNDYKKGA